jgi:hypothetical protein
VNTQELVKYVTDFLTGGDLVPLNVKEEVVQSFVKDALERVTPYYKEKAIMETVTVIPSIGGTGTSGYIELSSLTHEVHVVDDVVPIESPTTGASFLQEMAGLLGLERSVIMDYYAVDYALWAQVRKDLVKSVGRDMRFKLIRTPTVNRIYIDDARPSMKVTVVYAPLPQDLDEVTWAPAVTWIKDWVIAMTEIAQSKVMGRVGADTLGFSLNAGEIGESGKAEKERLLAMLPDLHFSYGSARR